MSKQDKHPVGYMSPPKHTRFKKGRSGNPGGRPNKQEDINTLLQKVLMRKVRLQGTERQMQIREALIRKLRDLALSGDQRAISLQRHIIEEAGVGQTEYLDAEDKKQRVLNALRNMGVKVIKGGGDDA